MATTNSDYANFFPTERKSRLPGGYMGKMLRVDLSAGKFTELNIPEEPLLRKYWGGQLMAEYILLNELPLSIDPYDAENVIVGMTGPVTGTGFTPGGTKTCFVYLSPATRHTLGRAATSGYFGASLKAAGYDGMIITGVATKPSYLYIGEDKVELRDASKVWGKGVRATEELLRADSGHQDARVGCIGPAGENLIRAAMFVNDYNHTAAHGLGAVMGSKKLKAIVVWGTKRPRVARKNDLIEAGLRWRKALQPRVYTPAQKKKASVMATPGARLRNSIGAARSSPTRPKVMIRTTSFYVRAFSARACAHGTSRSAKAGTKERSATSTPAASGKILFTTWALKAMTFCIFPSASMIWASSAAITLAARAWHLKLGRKACSDPTARTA